MRNSSKAVESLTKLGWNPNFLKKSEDNLFQGVLESQRGFGFGHLSPDGDPGDLTIDAWEYSISLDGACTENFAYREFKSRYGIIRLHRDLPRGLEVLRKISGPIHIINGYRDPRHNREVGGASQSVHLSGAAVDATLPRIQLVLALGIFSGVGATVADGITRHVDLRNVDQWSTRSGGTPQKPALWGYKARGGTTAAPAAWYGYPTNGPGLPALGVWKGNGGKSEPKPAAPVVPAPASQGDPRDVEIESIKERISTIETATAAVKARVNQLER